MSDLISRADAIEAVRNEIQDFEKNYMHGEDDENFEHDIGFVAGLHRAKTFIRSLPSAETSQNLAEPNNGLKGSDLISRADAMGAVQDHFNANGFKGYDDGQKMMDRIKALPSADAVEVVRCKDCKWSDYYKTLNGEHRCYCNEHGSSGHTDDDYCSYGEREESEDEK